MKRNLLVSFSGGKTSAYMAAMLKSEYDDQYNLIFVFANTGQENEETLRFVDLVDKTFELNVVWVEAVFHPGRKSTTHQIVTFETATRDETLFESMCIKYGISNASWPHCTRELKQRPIHSFIRSLCWDKGDYETAIGIRTDETRRVNTKGNEFNPVYPLIDWFPTDKIDVNDYWDNQPFTLNLQEHQGNCKWCWKKSFSKHYRIMSENPEFYEVPDKLEKVYGRTGAEFKKNPESPNRVFFRSNKSVGILRKESKLMSLPDVDSNQDRDFGCSESCEFI